MEARQGFAVGALAAPHSALQGILGGCAGRFGCRSFLGDWPRSVRMIVLAQGFCQATTAVVLGALFDAYLQIAGGSNTFVGGVESARGLAALAVALPMGWAGDKFQKTTVMRFGTCLGMVAFSVLAVSIFTDTIHLVIVGAILGSIQSQCYLGLVPAVLAEIVPEGHQRTKAIGLSQTAASLGNACGSAFQAMFMIVLGTKHWTAEELHWVLCIGIGIFVPFVFCVWQIRLDGHAGDAREASVGPVNGSGRSDALLTPSSTASPANSVVEAGNEMSLKKRWLIATIAEVGSLITAIGSGMTFKYWPLFFKGDFGFSPLAVVIMQLSIWLIIAVGVSRITRIAKGIGRARTVFICHVTATALLFLLGSIKMSVWITVPIVLARNGIMNAASPLTTSIIVDMVPKERRGMWSSLATLRRMTWSGSAFIGGLLSDSHDYRFAFFVTACVHSFSGVMLLPIVALHKEPATQQ
eukprot:TRINITY_DN13099_c1_g1_i2.p1 TRINITY_DN13099_c1_g1~~TRINITY_DN13099_c1_g1_i2.p1  ORF type:complete len:468 (+),score=84.26 TRINITY_DN13099_c1_g1_i2:801-2204(+)